MSYRPHFGLERYPFEPLAASDELFPLQAGKETARRLAHLLELRGIGVLTGRPGSGKTTACRQFVAGLHPARHKVCYVSLTTGTAFDAYRLLAWELGLEPLHTRAGCYRLIRTELEHLRASRRQLPVLILDEAQNLRNDVLEELRLLTGSGLQAPRETCLLLVGLAGLERRLALAVNRSLDQRVVVRHRFPGLEREETAAYLAHRLELAGCARALFEPAAVEALYQASRGLLRPTDRIAHYALLAAALDKAPGVSPAHVERAVPEARAQSPVRRRAG